MNHNLRLLPDDLPAVCTPPTLGQYVLTPCVTGPGPAKPVTTDTVLLPCSNPVANLQYTTAVCVAGTITTAGTNTMISTCLIPATNQNIVSPCVSGTFQLLGTNTVVQNIMTSATLAPTTIITATTTTTTTANATMIASSIVKENTTAMWEISVILVLVIVLLIFLVMYLWRKRNSGDGKSNNEASVLNYINARINNVFHNPLRRDTNHVAFSQDNRNKPDIEVQIVVGADEEEAIIKDMNQLLITNDGNKIPHNIPAQLMYNWTDKFFFKLGKGGFGEVFRGTCGKGTSLEMNIAVKRIEEKVVEGFEADGENVVNSLKREINVLSSFRHPNIIKLLAYSLTEPNSASKGMEDTSKQPGGVKNKAGGSIRRTLFLIYELADNGDLNQILRREPTRLDWRKRVHVALGLARALHYLHTHDKGHPAYHRDIKSANVTLDSNWEAKLIDCGLAKYLPEEVTNAELAVSLTKTSNALFGTPGYMCPHYCDGNKYTVKCEIFSYGVVLAEILTGYLQGISRDDSGSFRKMAKEIRTLPADENAGDWPPEVVDLIRGIAVNCVTDYSLRTADFGVVIQDLEHLETKIGLV